MDDATWSSATPRARYILGLRAAEKAASRPLVFSHLSAAALWGLPVLGRWEGAAVHVAVGTSSGGRSSHGISRHGVAMELVTTHLVDGLIVTSVERTLIDLAATTSFASAVMSLDSALGGRDPLTTKERIRAESERLALRRGRRRVEHAVDFAVQNSGSPGESLSRARLFELGFPAPKLQVEFVHHTGITDRVDFDWEEYEHIGEFDGLGKYRDPRLMSGLTPEEIVIREKRREDRLRSQRPHFSRWEWSDALEPHRLAAILTEAGLPRSRGRR